MHCSQGKTDRQGRKRRQASEKMEVAKAMNYMDQYKFRLEDSYFDEGTKEELRKIADNQAEYSWSVGKIRTVWMTFYRIRRSV